MVIGEEQTITLSADYTVFKSPYTVDNEGKFNYICYDDRGVPLEKGTQVQIPTGEKMFVNLSCNNYNIDNGVDIFCGVPGLETNDGDFTSLYPNQKYTTSKFR